MTTNVDVADILNELDEVELRQLGYILGAFNYKEQGAAKTSKEELAKLLDLNKVTASLFYPETNGFVAILSLSGFNKSTDWVLSKEEFSNLDAVSEGLKYCLKNKEVENFFSIFDKDVYENLEVGMEIKKPFAGEMVSYEVVKKVPLEDKDESEDIAYGIYLKSKDNKEQVLEVRFMKESVNEYTDKWIDVTDKEEWEKNHN